MNVLDKIEKLRLDRGWSVYRLAEKAGIRRRNGILGSIAVSGKGKRESRGGCSYGNQFFDISKCIRSRNNDTDTAKPLVQTALKREKIMQ